jgi:hypothetical protein
LLKALDPAAFLVDGDQYVAIARRANSVNQLGNLFGILIIARKKDDRPGVGMVYFSFRLVSGLSLQHPALLGRSGDWLSLPCQYLDSF